jgi:hypothetical protein
VARHAGSNRTASDQRRWAPMASAGTDVPARERRLLVLAVLVAVGLLLGLALLVLRPPASSVPFDGSGADVDGVTEPDGVRASGAPEVPDLSPTPIVPEDADQLP